MTESTSGVSRSFWSRTKTNSKAGFDKVYKFVDKAGAPINRLSHRLGSEAFWPTTLDKESEKAARILRSFCKDGFYHEELYETADGPKQKQKVIKKIPPEVIRNAKGLAIFTTMRTGLWVSGAGGSGILIGRTEDGSWSPPSGIMLHTAGLGFLVGVDIYDCVLVLNTQEAVNAFAKWRCTIGGELSATAGPVGIGGVLESEVHKRQAPIFNYLKSRGFYAGVQVDGTVVIERTDENERFYRERITATEIVTGKVRHPPMELKMLFETLKAAQGDKMVDTSLLPTEPPPADFEVEEEGHTFGVPDKDDPDPYGVLALEKEGLAIKEAGSKIRASTDEFDFNPRLSSPIYTSYRRSIDNSSSGGSTRDSWRRSTLSSLEKRYVTTDSSTQTDFGPQSATYTSHISHAASPVRSPISEEEALNSNDETERIAVHSAETSSAPHSAIAAHESTTPTKVTTTQGDDDDDESEEDEDFQEVEQVTAPQIIRAKVVQVPKRVPPKLPPRNPNRSASVQTNDIDIASEDRQMDPSKSSTSLASDASKESSNNMCSTEPLDEHSHIPVSPTSSEDRALSVRSTRSEESSSRPSDSTLVETNQSIPEDKDAISEPSSGEESTSLTKVETVSMDPREDVDVDQSSKQHISLANIRTGMHSDDDDRSDASPIDRRVSNETRA